MTKQQLPENLGYVSHFRKTAQSKLSPNLVPLLNVDWKFPVWKILQSEVSLLIFSNRKTT
jgi:hypothetical protein